ncbi:MAG: VCBS repeat-containing protein [Acidobacteria bacterium]|nr:VCBS repeat-containing protein [Acidobacteriota bacterium]
MSSGAGPFAVTSPNTSVTVAGNSTQTVTWNVANATASPVSAASVRILPHDATVRTLVASTTGSWNGGWTVKAADFNGDGRTDLFLYNGTTGRWFKAINNGANNFAYYTELTSTGYHVAIGNFGPAGAVLDDVVFYNPTSGAWSKCISTGDGTAGFTCDSGSWDAGWQVHPVDTNSDNITDLYNSSTGQWFIIGGVSLNIVGSGTWSANWTVKSGDLNGDGRADIFLYNTATGEWFECFNNGAGDFTYASGRWDANWQISITSFNGDARADLLLYNSTTGTYVQCINTGSASFTYYAGSIGGGMTVVAARPFP